MKSRGDELLSQARAHAMSVKTRVAAEPRTYVLLGVFLLLAGFYVIRLAASTASPQDADAEIHTSAAGGVGAQEAALEVKPLVMQSRVVVPLPRGITRDLFLFDTDGYQLVQETPDGTGREQNSSDRPTDEQIRQQAQMLELQSTILGGQPKAMINGELVELGQVIEGFEVKAIRSQEVEVERLGVRVRLRM